MISSIRIHEGERDVAKADFPSASFSTQTLKFLRQWRSAPVSCTDSTIERTLTVTFVPGTADWNKKHDANPKMIRCSLPGDSPVGDAHYDLDVALDFLAIDGPRAREVGVVDLADGINERWKVFEP